MKSKLLIVLTWLLCHSLLLANNDRYRLIIADDPATTITIAWDQTSGSSPQVYYDTTDHGTNWSQYANIKSVDRSISFKGMDNRFARLSGLTPDTNYYFVIRDSQGTSQRFWFRTAPDDLSRLSFIAGGDSRNNRTPRQNANRLVSKLKPHAVFFGGDMTDDDTSSQWQDWFDDWQLTTASDGRMFPIVAARGNHEYDSSTIYNLFDTPNQDAYYAITFGDNLIRTYTLNSEISVSGNQLSWLQNDLNNSSGVQWKMAQYHKPMRPHTSGKSEGSSIYSAWAQLFYDKGVNVVVDCDSHLAKTTYPIKPSNGPNSDEGFEIDNQFGTVYTGEGSWGAPLRSSDDNKTWTRSSGSFNQFKLMFIDENKIELRTIRVDNANSVGENPNTDPFQLPNNIDIFSPSTGAVVTILSNTNNCPSAGTSCDDGDSNTVNDVEDGFCNCSGVPQSGTLNILASDDAEEGENGTVYLDSSDLELVFDSFNSQNNQTVGIRFSNIPLPSNSTITNAYIQFTADETDTGTTNLEIRGHYSGNSSSFSSSNNNISSRTLTSSQSLVSWNNVPAWNSVGQSDINQRTPNLSGIVQEILSHPSWVSNNAMSFVITGSGTRTAESLDGSSSDAPRLVITYSTTPIDTCNAPNALNVSNITTDSAQLNWNIESNASNGYEWIVMANGASPNPSNAISTGITSNTSVQVSGLNDNTEYDVFVRSDCGEGDLSDWSSLSNFTTIEDICNSPTNLQVTNNTGLNVDFSWNTVDGANNGYEWVVMADNDIPNISNALFTGNTSSTFAQVSGLTNLSSYDIYVRSNCGSGDISAWSNAAEITINNCPPSGTSCNDGNSNTINDIEDGFCNCQGVLPGGSINILVSDDVEQGESGAMYFDSSDIELVFDSFNSQNNQTVGLRFASVSIPQGAIITNSYIQFTADETDTGTTNLSINGEYNGNASSFSSANFNVSSRTQTSNSAEVSWNNVPSWNSVGESGAAQRTPDLSDIVQEIVLHPNWNTSNAMVFIITGSGSRAAESLDGTASSAARLVVDYSIIPEISCNPPGGLNASNITVDSADIDWDLELEASNGYEWILMSEGTPPNIATAIQNGTTSNTSISLNSLNNYTSYDVYVRSNCDNDEVSNWSTLNSFTTLEICNSPINLSLTNISTSSATIGWSAISNAGNGYEWIVMADGQLPNTANAEATGSTNNLSIDVNGLSSETIYNAYVRSNCNSGIQSNWSDGFVFNTLEVCDIPSNLVANYQSGTSIELIWDLSGSNSHEWVIMADGMSPDPSLAEFTGTTLSNSIVVYGLTNLTAYDAYVRADCGNSNLSNWSSASEFFINNCPASGTSCDDGDDCTTGDVQDGFCNCVGTLQDSDNDGVCDADDLCPSLDDTLIGTSCDDGDNCTTGEVYDTDCNCSGGIFADSDGDGVCDSEDLCPEGDDNIDTNNNGIPDACDTTCTYTLINFNNFDSTWGIWNDGGSDCRRSSRDASFAYSGSRCVRLRDNTSSSVMTTDNLNLTSYDEITISFTYLPVSMDNSNEDFWLQLSTDGGATYSTIEEWNRDDEFINNVREFDVVSFSGPFTANTRLRFRCDASGNSDWVYIDDVEITGCQNSLFSKGPNDNQTSSKPISNNNSIVTLEAGITDLSFYPNPIHSNLNIEFISESKEESSIRIFDILGREKRHIIQNAQEGLNKISIDLVDLTSGYYFMEIKIGQEKVIKKIVKQ